MLTPFYASTSGLNAFRIFEKQPFQSQILINERKLISHREHHQPIMTDSPSSLPLSTSSSSLPGGTLGGVDSDRSNDDPSLLSAFMALVLAEYAKFEDGPRLTEGLNKVSTDREV